MMGQDLKTANEEVTDASFVPAMAEGSSGQKKSTCATFPGCFPWEQVCKDSKRPGGTQVICGACTGHYNA